MKKILLFVFILFATATLFAQTKSIIGKIIDTKTKEPMTGANVVVKGTKIGAVADVDGKFALEVPVDAKTLTITYIGYNAKDVSIGNSTSFSVSMEAAETLSGEVVVTSSRVAESIKQAPLQIEKMTSREIKSAASGDFYQSIGNYKGIDIITTSSGFKVINLRGFGDTRSLRTKQFIDGIDNEAPGLNFPIGNMVGANDLDLESVEIISGAASSLYGANAMQGVISMRSKNPYDFQGFSAQIKGGGTLAPAPYVDAQFRYAQAFGKSQRFAIKLTGEYTQTKDWVADDDSFNRYGNINADVNVIGALRKKVYLPYCPTCPITNEQHDKYVKLNGFLDFNPTANNLDSTVQGGYVHFHAPGYMEKDLADYNAKNAKISAELHYRFKNDIELIGSYKFGYGTAVYQATARYQIKEFTFHQPKIEIKGKNFFVRAYGAIEDAGKSYNIGLTGAYISRSALRDSVAAKYSSVYFTTLDSIVGGFSNCTDCFENRPNDPRIVYARQVARDESEKEWYSVGSQLFKDSFNRYIAETNSLEGTKFYDKSMMWHVEGQYDWDFVKWLDIITGASYRIYMPNSRGTIFEDTAGKVLRVHEVGAYLQMTKRLFNDNFKIMASIRVDKNSNFKAQVSPRGSLVYTVKAKNSDHTFRASVTSAFRTPTLQDQYLYLNIGRLFLVGNSTGYTNLFTRESTLEYYRTPGDADAKSKLDLLKPTTLAPLKPEQVFSVEFGYRTEIKKRVYIDVSAYWSRYSNFIGFQRVVKTRAGDANADRTSQAFEDAVNCIIVSDSTNSKEFGPDQKYYTVYQMWVNATTKVPSWGAAISIAYYVGKGITPYVNYTYTDLDEANLKNNGSTVLSGFNTPKHKFNIGVNANKVVGGLGFSANFKWVTSYNWQSPFADGKVPSFHTLDFQIFYDIEKAYSTIRFGASNIYNNRHIEAVGSPKIGALYYAGWTFDFNKFKKPGTTASAQ